MFYIKYLTNIRQLFHFSITAVAGCKFGQCRGEIFLAEFRPHLLDEQEFRVCSLPQEIVADTLFAGGADYQVRIRNSVGDQIFGKGRHISDFVNVFAGMLYDMGIEITVEEAELLRAEAARHIDPDENPAHPYILKITDYIIDKASLMKADKSVKHKFKWLLSAVKGDWK